MRFSRNFAVTIIVMFIGCLHPVCGDVDFTQWHPPAPGDVRGPCPALNSLANHGILHRDGRGMDLPTLMKGISEALNVGSDLTMPVGTVAILSSDNKLGLSFDLNDLSKHDELIEHDASLSRDDYYFGDNHSFNESVWQSVLDYFEDADIVSLKAAAKARYNRVKTQSEQNPEFTYSAKNMVISYTETAQYLSVFGDPITGRPPVEWVKIFFEEERLPYNEGWRPSTIPTNLVSVVAMTLELIAAGGEILPEGLEVTENTVGKILAGKPIEGLIGNIPL